jgi:hypothetical protein
MVRFVADGMKGCSIIFDSFPRTDMSLICLLAFTAKPRTPPKKKPEDTDSQISANSGADDADDADSSGYSGQGGYETSAVTSTEQQSKTAPVGPKARGHTIVFLGVAAVAGVAIAAATVPKRQIQTQDHPLTGSVNRRINMFSHLAGRAQDRTARPSRRGADGSYVNADEIIA